MTIAKNTNKAKQALANAKNIRCFSLSDNFSGKLIAEQPVIWGGEIVNNQYTKLIPVSQAEFLMHELAGRNSKLTSAGNGRFTLHVHSNLWYTFDVHSHDFTLTADDMLQCACGARRCL